jgi:hypothetical protein
VYEAAFVGTLGHDASIVEAAVRAPVELPVPVEVLVERPPERPVVAAALGAESPSTSRRTAQAQPVFPLDVDTWR